MNWEEASRNAVTVEDLVLQQEALVARGETLVGKSVKVRGFLVLVDDSPPDAAYGWDPKQCVFPAFLVEESSEVKEIADHHLMHNLLRRSEYIPDHVIAVENDRYFFMRLNKALPNETFLEESYLWAAVPAVMTGVVVPSSRPDLSLGIQPTSTTARRPYDKDREFTTTF